MNLRTASVAALACTSVLLVGCAKKNGANVEVKQPGAKNVSDGVTPLESLRADAKSDPTARQFLYSSDPFPEFPALATDIHRDYVNDFIGQSGNGIGRPGLARPRYWTELVAVSSGERSLGVGRSGDGTFNSDRYDARTETLTLRDGTRLARRERVWILLDRQLMSVNAPTGPAVYLQSPSLLSQLTNSKFNGASAETMRLDAFETEALKKLRAGDEVVLRSDDRRLRMLGAIRARTHCLECHKGEVGTLLGAFTYTLEAQSEETPEEHWMKDLAFLTEQQLSAVRAIEAVGGKVIRTSPGGPVTEVRMTFSRNQEIAAKPRLQSTRLQLRDSELLHALAFPDLTVLDVSDSLVTDAGLKTIAELKSLTWLDLRFTWATAEGIEELKKALPKCEVITDKSVP